METDTQSNDASGVPGVPDAPESSQPSNWKGILSFDVGIVHLAYCLIRVESIPAKRRVSASAAAAAPAPQGTILAWDVLCLAEEGEKAKRIPLEVLGIRLFKKLDALWAQYNSKIQIVLIENQPSRLNGHMKSVQMMIYSYFLYKTVPASFPALTHSTHSTPAPATHTGTTASTLDVRLINASGKLKTHDTAMTQLPESTKEGYQRNKWASIQITQYYLRDTTEWKERLSHHKKKDDLCDAFLQGLAWFHKTYKCELTNIGDANACDLTDHWGHSYI